MKKNCSRTVAVLLTAVLLFGLAACAAPAESPGDGTLRVVTTIFPPYDFVRSIAGENVQITMLIRPGTDAHSYDPTPSDMMAISACDVFIMTGGESDEWAETLLAGFTENSIRVVRMMDAVDTVEEETVAGMTVFEEGAEAEGEPEYDEHVWTSPRNAVLITDAILEALCAADPAHADTFRQNALSYEAELQELDRAYADACAHAVYHTVVFGDRFPFRYLFDAYGLSYYAAFPGCSSKAEPSVKTMMFLTDRIRTDRLPAVFCAEYSNRSIAETLAAETGCEILEMHSCHTLSREEIDGGATYLSIMYRNLENLKRGLGIWN